ncbi:MAG TPA: hypothetical protein DHD79_10670 [Firmicutes bacterium]|nr:hypothetical protein [Bacillota bacterium]HAW71553.1 hypothetical protein [Bacillota bacterium]HBE05298.1 hypothetical protein [Bacillota bacterium]HBG43316.1 hypothetical protein [Bacillota bacterium]HBL48695.1 hypothetical protein [Bacillota bacterium]
MTNLQTKQRESVCATSATLEKHNRILYVKHWHRLVLLFWQEGIFIIATVLQNRFWKTNISKRIERNDIQGGVLLK